MNLDIFIDHWKIVQIDTRVKIEYRFYCMIKY